MTQETDWVGKTGTEAAASLDNNFDELYAAIDGTEVGDMDAGTKPDGTEILPSVQGGVAVSLTTDQLKGNAVDNAIGMARDKRLHFCDFQGINDGEIYNSPAVAGDAQYLGCEPWVAYLDDASSQLYALGWSFFQFGGIGLNTASDDSGLDGWVSAVSTLRPFLFDPGNSVDMRFGLLHDTYPNDPGVQGHYTLRVGLFQTPDGTGAAPSYGTYFELNPTTDTWHCVIDDGTTKYTFDTLVQVTLFTLFVGDPSQIYRIEHNATDAVTRFYIGDVMIHEKLISEANWADAGVGQMSYGVSINKETTAAGAKVFIVTMSLDEDVTRVVEGGALLL